MKGGMIIDTYFVNADQTNVLSCLIFSASTERLQNTRHQEQQQLCVFTVPLCSAPTHCGLHL